MLTQYKRTKNKTLVNRKLYVFSIVSSADGLTNKTVENLYTFETILLSAENLKYNLAAKYLIWSKKLRKK